MNIQTTDVVVIGSGAAGLYTALSLAPQSVMLVTKAPQLISGSTAYAQGGMAAAMARQDSPVEHTANTLFAGAGLVDKEAADVLSYTAPDVMVHLMALGMPFDKNTDGTLALGQEAAHSCRRILHAGGDATGRALSETLAKAAEAASHIEVMTGATVWQILMDASGITGVLVHQPDMGWVTVRCRHIVLATGGAGQLFSHTTNPTTATADGLALAYHAGATLADIEFMQFHPTTLDVEAIDGRRPLLTEALRGEGAHLLDANGYRFMLDEHPDAELAPRDVVARAVWARRAADGKVYLDARALAAKGLAHEFPTVWGLCAAHGLDPATDLLPIAPAAHYHMGGVRTDLYGRTDVNGLWAVGEVARTGLHGANRLASNSLTECLVFGRRAAEKILQTKRPVGAATAQVPYLSPLKKPRNLQEEAGIAMYKGMGLVRHKEGMEATLTKLSNLSAAYLRGEHNAHSPADHMAYRSVLLVARLMTEHALMRAESRGGHYRSDYPKQDKTWQRTQTCRKQEDIQNDDLSTAASAML